jgi:LPXTG-site transpeptidase (sortase) family protein
MKNVIKSIVIVMYLVCVIMHSPTTNVIAIVKVQADYNANITKSFNPEIIGSSELTRLSILINNPNNFVLTNAALIDSFPAGLTIAPTPKVTSDCAGLITATAGSAFISLSRGFVSANGSCSVAVDVVANSSGDFVNTIDAETFTANGGAVSNTNPASDMLTVAAYQYTAKLIKSFLPAYTSLGDISTLSITISNPTTFTLSNAVWSDTLPSGLLIAAIPNPVLTNCGSGSVTANPGESTISLSGASVPAKDGTGDGLCTVSVDVVAGQAGILTNTMGADSLTATGNGGTVSNPFPASAVINVSTFNFSAEINKSFNPAIINPGETSTLSITIYNPNPFQLTNAAWVDHLDSIQPGITIAANPNIVNDMATGCGGIISASPGGTSVSLNGGTVPAWVGGINGQCTISVDVTSTTQGNLTNTIPSGALTSDGEGGVKIGNTDPASRTLRINPIDAPSVTKSFVQNTVWVGQNSRMTINIKNNDAGNAITETSLTDILPSGVVLENTVTETHSNCGSSVSVTAVSGTDMVIINNATILPNATCAVAVNVKSALSDEYTNHIDVGAVHTKQGVTNSSVAEANLNVQAVGITKAFLPTTFQAGDTSVLTITLENRDTLQDYTDVYLKDTLPGTLEAVSASTDCINDLNDQTVDLSGIPLKVIELNRGKVVKAVDSSTPTKCYIYVTVTTPSGAVKTDTTYINTIAKGVMTTYEEITNLTAANANVTVTPITIGLAKSFSPNRFQAGGSSVLTITLRNDTTKPFTNVGLVDVMPAGLLIKDSPAPSTTCAGSTVSVSYTNPPATDPSEITLSGASLPAGTLCYVTATVTTAPGATTQNYYNTIPAETVTSEENVTNLTRTNGGVDIYTTGLGVTGSKSFNPSVVLARVSSRLTIDLYAPADQTLHGFNMTDTLPSGLTIYSTPNISTSGCGVLATATAGDNKVELSGGTIIAEALCRIQVNVTGTLPATYTNTLYPANITNDEGQSLSQAITADLRITNLKIRKVFYPTIVSPNGLSTLTITLENTNDVALTNVILTDSLNTMGNSTNGVIVAPIPNKSTTCGSGLVTAVAGSKTISMTGGTIPAKIGSVNGLCTILVDVQGKRNVTSPPSVQFDNNIPVANVSGKVGTTGPTIQPELPATAPLTITDLVLGVVKGFDPLTVFGGTLSTLSITLDNANNTVLTGIAFTDTMPVGMFIANPVNPSTGTCGGTLVAVPGGSQFSYSGGVLGANRRCTISLNATMNVNGNRTNTIAALAVTSFNGAKNMQPASATLTNLPGASITKFFTPNSIVLGDTSLLTIRIKNTGNIPLTKIGLVDILPSGLLIEALPAPDTTCDNASTPNLIIDQVTRRIELVGGSLAAGPNTTCDINVTVSAVSPGSYTNTIPARTLVTDEDATNPDPASDTLTVNSTPDLQLVKAGILDMSVVPPTTSAETGDKINYTLVATNMGDVTLTNVTIADADPAITIGTCTPAQPATLLKGETLSCPAVYTLTDADIINQLYSNTATATSKLPDGITDGPTDTDTENIPLNVPFSLGIKKVVTNIGPFRLNDTIVYSITATNLGLNSLTNVQVTDPGTGVTLGTCLPILGSTLASGESLVCSATHHVTISDVNSGYFSNTAIADSIETDPPVTDTATVPIKQNARIEVFKEVISIGPYSVGSTITYDISAKNTGDQTLHNVGISDLVELPLDPEDPDYKVTLGTCTPAQPADLEPDAILSCSATHLVTANNMLAGGFRNKAKATSDETGEVTDSAIVILKTPSIQLSKSGALDDLNSNGRADVGESINYTFTITNNGQVTLTDIILTDIVGGVAIIRNPAAPSPLILAPGESDSSTFTGTYTLTQADIDADVFTNIAIVTGFPPIGSPVSTSANHTENLAEPAIDLVKSEDHSTFSNPVTAGDNVSYSFTVENTGNVTLNSISLVDAKCNSGPTYQSGDTSNGGLLDVTETWTFTCTHTLTQADIDDTTHQITNTATVTSKVPDGGTGPTDTDTKTVPLTAAPGINLVKSEDHSTFSNPVMAGDNVSYSFTVENTGNITLNSISLEDAKCDTGPTYQSGDTANTGLLDVTETWIFTCTHTLTLADINFGSITNTADVSGKSPTDEVVNDRDEITISLEASPLLGIAKRVIEGPSETSPGTWEVTFSFVVRNFGNVTLKNIQVTDDLTNTFVTPPSVITPTTFTILSVTSTDFTENWPAGYNGNSDINLLMGVGTDILEPGESGTITLKIEVIPSYGGPFLNTAVARGNPPSGDPVSDVSQDGIDPDPDPKDGDPTNNNDPTPIDFGPRMFDPPYGIKLLDRTLQPVLRWTMVWINDTNIVAVNGAVSDPIPFGTVFEDNGIGSGYPLPPDPLPAGSIASGVSCEDTSGITSTKYCYYEGLTDKYPRGRIVWQGTLGPDLGVIDPLIAVNDIQISFHVRLNKGVRNVLNTATIDSDLNGDGDPSDEGELDVASASLTYRNLKGLPRTGFAPGVLTRIPSQSNDELYSEMNGMWLEIPSLGLKSAIVGVPVNEAGEWDVTWLGNQVGWLNGTAFPTWNGNSLLTAHVTDTNGNPGLFVDLGKMSWGNKILIHSWGQIYTYEVRSVNLWISPDSISAVTKHEELPWITMITCHDYNEKLDTYLWRTMVRAVLVNISDD